MLANADRGPEMVATQVSGAPEGSSVSRLLAEVVFYALDEAWIEEACQYGR
jgi:hypothetical protein